MSWDICPYVSEVNRKSQSGKREKKGKRLSLKQAVFRNEFFLLKWGGGEKKKRENVLPRNTGRQRENREKMTIMKERW